MIPKQWREDFITSHVGRYLLQQGISAAPILLRRFCTMLAHQQGATINLSKLAGSLGIDGKTLTRFAGRPVPRALTPPVDAQRRETIGHVTGKRRIADADVAKVEAHV